MGKKLIVYLRNNEEIWKIITIIQGSKGDFYIHTPFSTSKFSRHVSGQTHIKSTIKNLPDPFGLQKEDDYIFPPMWRQKLTEFNGFESMSTVGININALKGATKAISVEKFTQNVIFDITRYEDWVNVALCLTSKNYPLPDFSSQFLNPQMFIFKNVEPWILLVTGTVPKNEL